MYSEHVSGDVARWNSADEDNFTQVSHICKATIRCISTFDILKLNLEPWDLKIGHFYRAIFVIGHSHSGWYILQQDLERGREVPPRRQYCLPPLQCPRIPPGTFFQSFSQNHPVPWYVMWFFNSKSNTYFLQCPISGNFVSPLPFSSLQFMILSWHSVASGQSSSQSSSQWEVIFKTTEIRIPSIVPRVQLFHWIIPTLQPLTRSQFSPGFISFCSDWSRVILQLCLQIYHVNVNIGLQGPSISRQSTCEGHCRLFLN